MLNGMNFNNIAPPYQPNYYSSQNTQNNSSNTVQGNTIWVQGYEGANSFRTTPNSLYVLLDNNLERIYLKSTDNIGMCTGLRRFKLVEEKEDYKSASSSDLNDYVRKDELQELLKSFLTPQEEKEEIKVEVIPREESVKNEQPIFKF